MSEPGLKFNRPAGWSDTPVTLEKAAELVKASLSKNSLYKLPNRLALEHLAARLTEVRDLVLIIPHNRDEAMPVLSDPTALTAAETLHAAVVRRISAIEMSLGHFTFEEVKDAVVNLKAFNSSLHAILPYLEPRESWQKESERWQWFAPIVACAFRTAMESTNQGRQLGISDEGPVVKFVGAVLREFHPNKPTNAAIAKHFQRLEQMDRDKA
jgi:hypothetical protein